MQRARRVLLRCSQRIREGVGKLEQIVEAHVHQRDLGVQRVADVVTADLHQQVAHQQQRVNEGREVEIDVVERDQVAEVAFQVEDGVEGRADLQVGERETSGSCGQVFQHRDGGLAAGEGHLRDEGGKVVGAGRNGVNGDPCAAQEVFAEVAGQAEFLDGLANENRATREGDLVAPLGEDIAQVGRQVDGSGAQRHERQVAVERHIEMDVCQARQAGGVEQVVDVGAGRVEVNVGGGGILVGIDGQVREPVRQRVDELGERDLAVGAHAAAHSRVLQADAEIGRDRCIAGQLHANEAEVRERVDTPWRRDRQVGL